MPVGAGRPVPEPVPAQCAEAVAVSVHGSRVDASL